MSGRYVTVDVFTDRIGGGNPLAVVLDAQELSAGRMLAIAREFNYSETTFVFPPRDHRNSAHVRIFTPSGEVPFAGHPNVGTAFVLASEAARRGDAVPERYLFEEEAGLVPVPLLWEDASLRGAQFEAPQPLSHGPEAEPELVAACISLPEKEICLDRHPPLVLSVGLPFLVVELASPDALSRIRPDRAAYDALLPLGGARAVYAYTRDVKATTPACDFEARMFTPRMTEDPATGSATAAAALFLASQVRVSAEVVRFRFRQGVDLGRPSLLDVCVLPQGGFDRVLVGGGCAEVMRGHLKAP